MKRLAGSRGNSSLEFTLVGVPLLFVILSTFEMARGMWLYHTLAYAVKEGMRYTIVHGASCTVTGNSCQVTLGQVAQRIKSSGPGLIPNKMTVTFTTAGGSNTCTLNNCATDATIWPAAPNNARGMDLQIRAVYPFQSAICLFWPGAGRVSFTNVNLPASARAQIQF